MVETELHVLLLKKCPPFRFLKIVAMPSKFLFKVTCDSFPKSNQEFENKLKRIRRSTVIGFGEKDPEATLQRVLLCAFFVDNLQ